MPNPKRKHTRSRRDSRRSQNWKLEVKELVPCGQCGALRIPHRVCPSCGFYNGKLEVAKKAPKQEEGEEKK
ncbi:MAG TPA: 50S ribosomal protein L32 [Elusimicrobia bacterium]|nr:MAG: 50S ribosomal protein L32 [Elusimicrobia bacterium GWF2_62_30]HBA59938.1 50S ribosomal protein L32 [Elusimicrobiota bacterium]